MIATAAWSLRSSVRISGRIYHSSCGRQLLRKVLNVHLENLLDQVHQKGNILFQRYSCNPDPWGERRNNVPTSSFDAVRRVKLALKKGVSNPEVDHRGQNFGTEIMLGFEPHSHSQSALPVSQPTTCIGLVLLSWGTGTTSWNRGRTSLSDSRPGRGAVA